MWLKFGQPQPQAPSPLCPQAFVPDFTLSEGLHVFLHEVVRGIKAQEQGHV